MLNLACNQYAKKKSSLYIGSLGGGIPVLAVPDTIIAVAVPRKPHLLISLSTPPSPT